MQAEYHRADSGPTRNYRNERRGVSRATIIEAAKAAVDTIDLADRICGPGRLRRVGNRWVAHCPLPDHEDRSPSFTVYPETNSWYCFGCSRGGDVVNLAAAAWGYGKREQAMAAAHVLHEYGHPIPERPASWFRKQERQKRTREQIEAARLEYIRRRCFRVWAEPLLEGIEDLDERREDAQALWEAMLPVAQALLEGMRR